jgi:hypothetical protein
MTRPEATFRLRCLRLWAAPFTFNTIPYETRKAFATRGESDKALAADGGDSSEVIANAFRGGSRPFGGVWRPNNVSNLPVA